MSSQRAHLRPALEQLWEALHMVAHEARQSDLDVETFLHDQGLQGLRDLPGFTQSSSSSSATRQVAGTSTYANQFRREGPSSSFSGKFLWV